MAAGRTKTTWKPGQGGKPKGAKDAVPRSFKASIRAVFADLERADPTLIRAAVERGLRSRKPKDAFPYVRIYAELSGELQHQIQVSGEIDVPSLRTALSGRIARLAARLGAGDVARDPQ